MSAKQRFVSEFRKFTHKHAPHTVFADFLAMAATSLSQVPFRCEKREADYMQRVAKYDKEDTHRLAGLLGITIAALEEDGGADFLGPITHELELANEWAGQFFTPAPVSKAIAEMLVHDLKDRFEAGERLTVAEPAVGPGGMLLAMYAAVRDCGFNPQQLLWFHATDVDIRCVHAAFIQLTLSGFPGVVVHGNSITQETWGHWYTPQHHLGLWDWHLRRKAQEEATPPVAVIGGRDRPRPRRNTVLSR